MHVAPILHRYLVALGSNLGDRASYLSAARAHVEQHLGVVVAASPTYETAPVGAADQAFLNAALVTETALGPKAALQALLDIETRMGRVRRERWGNRTIDLDLILWQPPEMTRGTATSTFDGPGLTIPHPEALHRPFVLVPAADVAPAWRHPITGRTLAEELADRRAHSDAASSWRPASWA